jgi:hypothetical protein
VGIAHPTDGYYLKTQQWKDADQETYRLMITAIGKEDGGVPT